MVRKIADKTTDKRLKILGDDEIDTLYGLPKFTNEERELYFTLSPGEAGVMNGLHTFQSRVYFILQLGYFKARRQFYVFSTSEVQEDAQYVQESYFPLIALPSDFKIAKGTRLEQQDKILDLCRYRTCDSTMKQHLIFKAQDTARIDSKPIYIFREIMQYLTDERCMAPGYSFFQDIIGQALNYEHERLTKIVDQQLTEIEQQQLADLVAESDEHYLITRLKRNPKAFSVREIAHEIQRGETLRPLYKTAQRILPHLAISNESIKYYAQLVDYYSVFQLTQHDQKLRAVYLLCFVYHRYRKVNDHLITAFIYHVKHYSDEAKQEAKQRVYEYRLEHNRNLPKAGQVLKLFTEDEPVPETLFESVQTDAFAILEREQLDRMATYLALDAQFDEMSFQWEYLDKINRRFKMRLRPIFKSVDWTMWSAQHPLLVAVCFLADLFQKDGTLTQTPLDRLPIGIISKQLKPYLYELGPDHEKQLRVDRYEFLVYRLLVIGLEAGNCFCRDSLRFRSFEEDLVNDEHWQNKNILLTTSGLAKLTTPIEVHLADLENALEERLAAVNQRILSGENESIKTKKRGQARRWVLSQLRTEETINHPFFDSLPQIDLSSILYFAHKSCGWLDAFDHVLKRYGKSQADDRVLIACLIAWGTNMGLGRMGAISDIDYATLAATSEHFIRPETLQSANDLITNAIVHLPIFHHYDLGDTLHSSSDGQRFETRLPTFNARYSSKYFGLKKGVVAYTLIANHIPITARIIGADEHESHYVFDVLFNNTSDLQPTIHSTDSHGTNEVNFAILDCFGYQFAPRYKDIFNKVSTALYGFKHPSQYPTDWTIRPIRKINKPLIRDEWDNLQRIMVSLALKTTTQNIIIRKLSSHARKNRTQRALWEYDHIFRSLYLLDYLDSPALRRNVQSALNRGENYHQLRRAVSYANFGKLRFKSESEQQIWNECSRLITNCIIFYNATLLSNLLLVKQRHGDGQQVALLKHISPIAWQHINFYGRYTFTTLPAPIDVEALIHAIAYLTIRSYPTE